MNQRLINIADHSQCPIHSCNLPLRPLPVSFSRLHLEKRPAEFKNKVSTDMPDYFPWWDERGYK